MGTVNPARQLLLLCWSSTFHCPPGSTCAHGVRYDLSPTLHPISGLAEILGGLGLILPEGTRIQTRLMPLAAESAPNLSKPKIKF